MNVKPERFPLLRISSGNAVLLSAVYLTLALLAEVAHHFWQSVWAERILVALEGLPARVLQWVGVWNVLQRGYFQGWLNEAGLRAILGGTMVSLVFLVSLWVGMLLWLLRWMLTSKKTPNSSV